MLADYKTKVAALSPVGHWPLDETSGTTYADTQGNDAAAASAPSRVTGPDGACQAVDFAATNNRIGLPASNVTMPESHSFAFWIKCNSTPAGDGMALEWATASFAKYVQYDLGYTGTISGFSAGARSLYSSYYGTVAGSNGAHHPDTDLGTGVWKFVVVTFDNTAGSGTALKVYINGTLASVTTGLTNYAQSTGSPGAGVLGIGGRGQGGRLVALDGALSGVALFTGILSSTNISDLYNAMLQVPATKTLTASSTTAAALARTPKKVAPVTSTEALAIVKQALAVRTAAGSGGPGLAGSGPQTIIADSGSSDSLNYNAFPGGCKMSNGNLLVAWHHANDHVGSSTNKLYCVIGTPNGDDTYTFGAPMTLATTTGTGGSGNIADVGCILLANGDTAVTWNESTTPGHATINTIVRWKYRKTSDNGSTFATEVSQAVPGWATTVTAGSGGGAYAVAPCKPVQVPVGQPNAGRIYLATYGWDNRAIEDGGGSFSSHEYVKLMYSDDSLATWTQKSTIFPDTAGVAYDETDLLLLDTGDLLAACRTITGSGTGYDIKTRKSSDGGTTWNTIQTALGNDTTTGWGGRPDLAQTATGAVLLRTRYMNAGVSSWSGIRVSHTRGDSWDSTEYDPYDGTANRTGAVSGTGRGPDVYGIFIPIAGDKVFYIWSEESGPGGAGAAIYGRMVTASNASTTAATSIPGKAIAGARATTTTATAVVRRVASRALSTAFTISALLAAGAARFKTLASSSSTSAAITAARVALKALAVTSTASAAVARATQVARTAPTSLAALIVRAATRATGAATTTGATVAKQDARAVTASSSLAVTLTPLRVIPRTLSAGATAAAALIRSARPTRSSSTTTAGTITRSTSRPLAVATAAAALLVKAPRRVWSAVTLSAASMGFSTGAAIQYFTHAARGVMRIMRRTPSTSTAHARNPATSRARTVLRVVSRIYPK